MSPAKQPNIIYILADDMGYGDMRCNNHDCRIPTPHLDTLATNGMRFSDAHAGSAVCTPSRYTLLTGRYAWRTQLKRGIVWEWDNPLIDADRPTIASFLKQNGYSTHCLGKWHLGWEWTTKHGECAGDLVSLGIREQKLREAMDADIDWSAELTGGPVDRGFDDYFGVDVPNFPPYAWIDNRHIVGTPSQPKPDSMFGNPGSMVPGWSLEAVIPTCTERAVALIESKEDQTDPFFLYFPLTSPHTPICPNDAFTGMSGIGDYGDFVCEVDWIVGQILDALARTGQLDDTLVIFTSDNGPEDIPCADSGCYERARTTRHFSMGDWRGCKRDNWEGGHRVPFIAHWPRAIEAGTTCPHPVCLGDFFATCAEILQVPVPDGAAEDSVSMLPLLQGSDTPTRDHIIHHAADGSFAIRRGDWVLIDAPAGGTEEPVWYRKERGYTAHDEAGELFHLHEDPSERSNRYAEEPELVASMQALLERAKEVGKSADQSAKPVIDESE